MRIGDKLKAVELHALSKEIMVAGKFKIVSDGLTISSKVQGECELSKTKAQRVYADMVVPAPAFDKLGNLTIDSVTVGVSFIRIQTMQSVMDFR